jgi:hypothetical protein
MVSFSKTYHFKCPLWVLWIGYVEKKVIGQRLFIFDEVSCAPVGERKDMASVHFYLKLKSDNLP